MHSLLGSQKVREEGIRVHPDGGWWSEGLLASWGLEWVLLASWLADISASQMVCSSLWADCKRINSIRFVKLTTPILLKTGCATPSGKHTKNEPLSMGSGT